MKTESNWQPKSTCDTLFFYMATLTIENYSQGFLVDEDLMAGVSPHPSQADHFVAFVLQHTTGEYLGYQPFDTLEGALSAIQQIPRNWTFEKTGGCGGCGQSGSCSVGGCGSGKCKQGVCEV